MFIIEYSSTYEKKYFCLVANIIVIYEKSPEISVVCKEGLLFFA